MKERCGISGQDSDRLSECEREVNNSFEVFILLFCRRDTRGGRPMYLKLYIVKIGNYLLLLVMNGFQSSLISSHSLYF